MRIKASEKCYEKVTTPENSRDSGPGSDCRKSLAEFSAQAENKIKTIFGRGVYVDKNTSQTASVEFVR